MKKIWNKFILIVIFIISCIVLFQVFIAYSQSNRDTNSYLMLINGNGTLNDTRLVAQERKILASGDKVRVIWDSSLAVIEWWDGSMTRLWWNTKISIEQNQISRDFTNINISFELIAWKTWSNIVSFISSDSSFTQTFDGIEAGVRGTVFNVDLDKGFLHVSEHAVEIKTPWNDIIRLSEWEVLNLNTFTFIQLREFIQELQDSVWVDINTSLDNEYINKLSRDLESIISTSNPFLYIMRFISPAYATEYVLNTYEQDKDVDSYIAGLWNKQKIKVYSHIFSIYQKMNFISADSEAYERKLRYKQALIDLDVDSENSSRLILTSWFDLEAITESWWSKWLSDTIKFLWKNIEKLPQADVSLLQGGFDSIPDGLLDEFSESFQELWDMLNIDISKIGDIDTDTIWDTLDSADKKLQEILENNFWSTLDKLSQ